MKFLQALGAPQISSFILLSLLLLRPNQLVRADIVNRTIDDSDGDEQTRAMPLYRPSTGDVWKDASCRDCAIHPNVTRAFKRTYTAATYNPRMGSASITLEFNGTSIWVYFILANNAGDGITTVTDCNFILDDDEPVHFRRAPDLTRTDYLYNQLVYERTGIPWGVHKLEISATSNFNSYIAFDYALYTHDDDPSTIVPTSTATSTTTTKTPSASASPTPTASHTVLPPGSGNNRAGTDSDSSPSSSSPTAAIAGGIAGGVTALLAFFLVLFLCRRRRRERLKDESAYQAPMLMLEVDHCTYSLTADPFADDSDRADRQTMRGSEAVQPLLALGPGGVVGGVAAASALQRGRSLQPSVSESMYSTDSYYPPGGVAPREYDPTDSSPFEDTAGSTSSTVYGPSAITEKQRLREHVDRNDAIPPGQLASGGTAPLRLATRADTSDHDNRERIRRSRQAEIDLRLRTVEQEMDDLERDIQKKVTIKRPRGPQRAWIGQTAGEDGGALEEMREQMRLMQQEIELLRENQGSEWAQGLSDEPPPGYSPAA